MSNLEIKNLMRNQSLLPEIATLYAACFAEGDSPEEGWGERAACWQRECADPDEKLIIPYTEVGTPCPKCKQPMTEAYPLTWTIDYIRGELSYPGAIGLIGLIDGIVAATSWAFEGNIKSIAKKKYPGNQIMIEKVVKAYEGIWPDQPTRYISEVFVGPNYRGKDFAQELVNRLVDTSTMPVTSRTLVTSPMTSILGYAGLAQVLTPGSDPSNKDRVFYIQPNN